MVGQLIAEAKERGCTEISLDATPEGKSLYKALGFIENKEGRGKNYVYFLNIYL